jgi:hypothetical protein
MKHERPHFRPIACVAMTMFLCAGASHARVLGADLLSWAGAIVNGAIPNGTAVKSTVADRFAQPPAAGGQGESTAGSGSTWVYDRAHGIAAWLENGDLTGSEILYVNSPPPGPLPSRDLSKVVSVRGLHLGMTPAEASKTLGVSTSAVKPMSGVLTLFTATHAPPCPTGPEGSCEIDAVIKFKAGKAYSIGIWH